MNSEKSSLGNVFWLTAPFVYISGVIVGSLFWFILDKVGASQLMMSIGYHVPLSVSSIVASVLLWRAADRNNVLVYRWIGRVLSILYFATVVYSVTNVAKHF